MTMIWKRTDNIGAAKIHAQLHAGIGQHFVFVKRNVNGVAKKRLVYAHARIFEQQEVKLMDVECVQLVRAVFDDPILHVSLLYGNVRDTGSWVECLRRFSVNGDEKSCRTVGIIGIEQLLGE